MLAGTFESKEALDLDEGRLERRITRAAALRLAAVGAAGLGFGPRSARAATSDAEALEAAARAFLASLSSAQRDRATFPFGSAERTRWHWTVPSSVPRNGLPLGAMSRRAATPRARAAARQQLAGRLSQGARHHGAPGRAAAPDTGIADPFDPDLFYVSVFGTPGARTWGWRLEGHHLSRHFTVVGDTLVAEPFFLGAWPTRADSAFRSVAKGYRTMPREEDAAREIVLLLDGALRKAGRVLSRSR